MTDKPDDRGLEQYLKGGSALSRRYREASVEPAPSQLDETVLALARAEAKRKARPSPWFAGLAFAASLVLAVNLAWNLREQAQPAAVQELDRIVQEDAARAAAQERKAEAPAAAPASPEAAKQPQARRAERAPARPDVSADTAGAAGGLAAHEREKHEAAKARRAEEPARDSRLGFAADAAPATSNQSGSANEEIMRKASEARVGPLPEGWYLRGNNAPAFQAAVDESVMHSAPDSLVLWRAGKGNEGCGRLERVVPAQPYRGNRVQLSATLQTQGIAKFAALGLAPDDARPQTSDLAPGDAPWHQRTVALDVPQSAEHLVQSVLLCGVGTVWIDDVQLRPIESEE